MYSTNNILTRSHLLKNKISHLVYEFDEKKTPFYKVQAAKDKIRKVFNLPQQPNIINNQRISKTNNNNTKIKREKILKQICYLSEHIYGGFDFDENDRNTLKVNGVQGKYIFDKSGLNNNEPDTYKHNFFFTSSQNDKCNVVSSSN